MTHNERVLRLLSDGKPHTHHEGYGLHVILHSRVADLRKQGYQILVWRDGENYLYQLLPVEGSSIPAGSSASLGSDSDRVGSRGGEPSTGSRQLPHDSGDAGPSFAHRDGPASFAMPEQLSLVEL